MKKTIILLFILNIGSRIQAQTLSDTLTAYPNPFSNTATIGFTTFNNDTITLKVYNLSGTTVKTFFQSTFLPQGTYSLTLIGDSLPFGMYFVVLNAGNNLTQVRKLFKKNPVNAISEAESKNCISIFPNPANETLTLPPTIQNSIVTITNITGNTVLQTTLNQTNQINISHLASGLYFIHAQTKNNIQTTKFIKQ
jgi:hypothetical protein